MFTQKKILRAVGVASMTALMVGSFGAMAARTLNSNASDGSSPLTDRNVNAGTGVDDKGYSTNGDNADASNEVKQKYYYSPSNSDSSARSSSSDIDSGSNAPQQRLPSDSPSSAPADNSGVIVR